MKKQEKQSLKLTHVTFRPTEVESLLGDPTKAKEKLGWVAEIGFDELVKEMVATDLEDAKKDVHLEKGGFAIQKHHE